MTKHAKERAFERYNTELTNLDLQQIINSIKNQEHIPLGCSQEDKNKKFCYVKYNHIPYKVLYHNEARGGCCKRPMKIITVYPFDPDEYNELLETKKQKQIEAAIKRLKDEGYIVYKRKKNARQI